MYSECLILSVLLIYTIVPWCNATRCVKCVMGRFWLMPTDTHNALFSVFYTCILQKRCTITIVTHLQYELIYHWALPHPQPDVCSIYVIIALIIIFFFFFMHPHLIPVYELVTQPCWIQPAWAILACRLYHWATFLQGFLCSSSSLPLICTSLSCHLRGTGLLGPAPADKHTFSAHPKPQLQRSWRYILSSACFLAPIQTHNEWSRSPQPGATPSTLFTLLPFTHSSCSSPNDAGPSYWWSKAGRRSLATLQTRPISVFNIQYHYFEMLCFNLIFSWACFLYCQPPTQRPLQPTWPSYGSLTVSQHQYI